MLSKKQHSLPESSGTLVFQKIDGTMETITDNGKPVRLNPGWQFVESINITHNLTLAHLTNTNNKPAGWLLDGQGRLLHGVKRDGRREAKNLQKNNFHDKKIYFGFNFLWIYISTTGLIPVKSNGFPYEIKEALNVSLIPLADSKYAIGYDDEIGNRRNIIVDESGEILGQRTENNEETSTECVKKTAISLYQLYETISHETQIRTVGSFDTFNFLKYYFEYLINSNKAKSGLLELSKNIEILSPLLDKIGFDEKSLLAANPGLNPSTLSAPNAAKREFLINPNLEPYCARLLRKPTSFSALACLKSLSGCEGSALRKKAAYPILLRMLVDEFGENAARILHGRIDQAPDQILNSLLKIETYGGKPLVIIGDSHSYSYHRSPFVTQDHWLLDLWLFCPGASAYGLINPQSKLRYGTRIKKFVSNINIIKSDIKIIMKFGQVDLEFVYQHRRIRDGIKKFNFDHFADFIEKMTNNYIKYLESVFSEEKRKNIYVLSINPPVLSDESWATGYIEARWTLDHDMSRHEADTIKEDIKLLEIPSLLERTKLHRLCNDLICKKSTESGFNYINEFDLYIDPENNKISNYFIGKTNGTDWHIDRKRSQNVSSAILGYIMEN